MNTWKVILATMLIFGTGVITGGLLVRQSERSQVVRPGKQNVRPNVPVSPSGMRVELLRRLERELDLSAEQHARVDRIIKESQDRTRKLMEPVAPQMREELQRTKERFRAELTPEQQQRFDELSSKPQQRPRDPRRPGGRPDSNLPSAAGEPQPPRNP